MRGGELAPYSPPPPWIRAWCVYVYICGQKQVICCLTIGKSLVSVIRVVGIISSVIYCSLVEFNGQKRGLPCQVIHSGKKI